MSTCIYCEKTENEATFKGREHVIPRLLGGFENNPTIMGYVCDDCNSKVFNLLETRFKEDTEEGISCQMLNFENSFQIRIRGRNVKSSFYPGLGNDFFNEMFPFFKFQDGDWKIFLLPQIKIKSPNENGYIVLLIDELKKIKQNSKKFLKVKGLLKGAQPKNISIFTGSESKTDFQPIDDVIKLLSDFGIKYKENERIIAASQSPTSNDEKQFKLSMDCTIENETARVISKIAFNYFAYCAISSNRAEILYNKNFSEIKSFILGKINLPVKEIITNLEDAPIIWDEKINKRRYLAHTVTFSLYNENIISEVSFLGKKIYTVKLGPTPNELLRADFGCGHLFCPVSKKIISLTQNPNKWGRDQKMYFGLFNRI